MGKTAELGLAMVMWGRGGSEGSAWPPSPPCGDAPVAMVTRCPAWGHPDPWLNSQRLSLLLLLLLLPGPSPALGMEEDASFPHLGESSQPPPRACPPRCSCPRADTVDCDGLELRVFPDNITRAAQHLSLQVGSGLGGAGGAGRHPVGRRSMGRAGVEGDGVGSVCRAEAWGMCVLALMEVDLYESVGVCGSGERR